MEILDPRDQGMEALLHLSPPWGHRPGVVFCLGTREGGLVAKVAGQGRCGLFGNDDAASGV
jgi:hypothetical protein